MVRYILLALLSLEMSKNVTGTHLWQIEVAEHSLQRNRPVGGVAEYKTISKSLSVPRWPH